VKDKIYTKVTPEIAEFLDDVLLDSLKTGSRVFELSSVTESTDYDYVVEANNLTDSIFNEQSDKALDRGEDDPTYGSGNAFITGTLNFEYYGWNINVVVVSNEDNSRALRAWEFATLFVKHACGVLAFKERITFDKQFRKDIFQKVFNSFAHIDS
jgi:hypothetical protein